MTQRLEESLYNTLNHVQPTMTCCGKTKSLKCKAMEQGVSRHCSSTLVPSLFSDPSALLVNKSENPRTSCIASADVITCHVSIGREAICEAI